MVDILSIQSQVTFGHVGNSAVTFPLQLLGHTVWPVPTAVLSNHGGYRENGGGVLPVETVRGLLNGLVPRGVPAACDLLLTGYLGSREVADLIRDEVARLRQANPHLRYCCDPVMGDRDTGLYVADGLGEFFRDIALASADILTPNAFELEELTGVSGDDPVAAARHLLAKMRPGGCVLITSFESPAVSENHVAMAAVNAHSAWMVRTPRFAFARAPHGAGDLAAALFSAHLTGMGDVPAALEDCASRLHAIFACTAERANSELALVDARVAFMTPRERFVARRID